MLIVEGFLTSLDYKSGRMERLKVEVSCQGITNHRGEGPFQPVELVQGVLYRLPEKETGKNAGSKTNNCHLNPS